MTAYRVSTPSWQLRRVPYEHADVARLVAALQAHYIELYGGPDETPVDADEFTTPDGAFFLTYEADEPIAMGGWRRLDPAAYGVPGERPVEIKRMYVARPYRGRGHARSMLGHLEADAAAAGVDWVVLMSGAPQAEAVGLYRSSGYTDIAAFGRYASEPDAVHLGKRLAR